MTTVFNVITGPLGAPTPNVPVLISLVTGEDGAWDTTDKQSVGGAVKIVTNAQGRWSADLEPNSEMSPPGTVYKIEEFIWGVPPVAYYILVTQQATEQWARDLLTDPPATLTPSALQAHLDDAVDAHDASAISFAPTGAIAAINVQAMGAELDAEKLAIAAHTKALHDALAIDAGTLDGLDSTAFQIRTEKAQPNGYASLDATGKVPNSQVPPLAISDTFVVNSQAAMLALTAEVGDIAIRTDISRVFILRVEPANVLGNWQELITPADAVQSVDGRVGVVSLSDLYVNETDHTKALHDALGIDAGTLDGIEGAALQLRSEKGQNNGYASLGGDGRVPASQLPTQAERRVVRQSTGSIAINTTVAVDCVFATPFADANYTVGWALETDTDMLRIVRISAKAADRVTIRVVNSSVVSAHTGIIHAVAVHD